MKINSSQQLRIIFPTNESNAVVSPNPKKETKNKIPSRSSVVTSR